MKMPKSNLKYWSDRLDDVFSHLDQTDLEFFYKLQDIYSQYGNEIQNELFSFYQQYAKEKGMTLSEAQQKLRKEDLSNYIENAANYRKQLEDDQEALDRLNEQYSSAKSTRLEALVTDINYQLLLMNKKIQVSFWEYLKSVANYAYRKIKYGNSPSTLDADAVKTILNMEWNGENFSSRIWGNTDRLAAKIKELLIDAFIKGKNPVEIARELRKAFNVTRVQAETLARTEATQVANTTAIKRYREMGLTKYQFSAHIDSRTTEICKNFNKKIFPLKDYKPGENAPPMHYNCRSGILPIEEEIGL